MTKPLLFIGLLLASAAPNAQEILSTEKLPEVVVKGNGETKLIDQYGLQEITAVGHSWGSMVAVQLAAKRPDVIKRLINVDGSIESTSWTPDDQEERLAQAGQVIQDWEPKLRNAEEWSKFNGAAVGLTLGNKDSVSTETMLTRIKLLSGFMATDREAMLQYWRENPLIDLTADLQKLSIPVLDIQSFTGADQKGQKEQYLETLRAAGAPAGVKAVFMYDTKHFIMYHRPAELDCLIESFIAGKEVVDFAPAESEYFEEEAMN
ncbi:MAG: alpha/beta hydrolase [Lewinellaceae bacterium]|nr:alpha/beta hydrolase [Lewinellaceae bacterium]